MKKAAKVFIWFGIIFQFYLIYPIVIGAIALKKIDSATSKNELRNFGIVTLLFCSMLGGIFMLLIDESEFDSSSCNGQENALTDKVIEYERVVLTDKQMRELNGGKTATATRVLMWCIIALSLISVVLSLSCIPFLLEESRYYNGWYYEDNYRHMAAWLTIFPGTMQALVIAIPVIMYFCNKQWAGKHCCRSLATLTPGLAAYFAIAVTGACWCNHALFILITVISFILLVIVVVTVSINHKIFYKSKRKVERSRLEVELNRLADLQERGVITENEYSVMREAAIKKYK